MPVKEERRKKDAHLWTDATAINKEVRKGGDNAHKEEKKSVFEQLSAVKRRKRKVNPHTNQSACHAAGV